MYHELFIALFLLCVGFVAAITDTIAGGGGLVTLPALLFSGLNPVVALGTNKFQTVVAEAGSTIYFLKKKEINLKIIVFGIFFVILGSVVGTFLLQIVPIKSLEKIIPILLTYVFVQLLFSFFRKAKEKQKAHFLDHKKYPFSILGASIGFYNGFFGPGTGSLWTMILMQFFKLDIKTAIMYTKPLNLAGNLSALLVFTLLSKVAYFYAFVMSLGAYAGSKVGGHIVLYKKLSWIKLFFIIILFISTLATYFKYY